MKLPRSRSWLAAMAGRAAGRRRRSCSIRATGPRQSGNWSAPPPSIDNSSPGWPPRVSGRLRRNATLVRWCRRKTARPRTPRRSRRSHREEPAMSYDIRQIQHVSLPIPPDDEALREGRRFYVEILGLREVDRPPALRNRGLWFRIGDQELHLFSEPGGVAVNPDSL